MKLRNAMMLLLPQRYRPKVSRLPQSKMPALSACEIDNLRRAHMAAKLQKAREECRALIAQFPPPPRPERVSVPGNFLNDLGRMMGDANFRVTLGEFVFAEEGTNVQI